MGFKFKGKCRVTDPEKADSAALEICQFLKRIQYLNVI